MKKLLILIAATLLTLPILAQEETPTYSMKSTPVITGLNFPVQAVQTPDSGWFVIERAGDLVRIHPDGTHETQVRYPDTNAWHERGALGVAVGHEGDDWYVFVQRTIEYTPEDMTDDGERRTGQITRFNLDDNYNVVVSTETAILGTVTGNLETPSCDDFPIGTDCIPADGRTHAPGTLQAYQQGDHVVILASEGEAAEDQTINRDGLRAQDINSLAGKILRFDYNGQGLADNPFFTGDPSDNASKVFALGFRNPFTFTYWFDNKQLKVGVCDVGAQDYEELNVANGGENFGWPFHEGPILNGGYKDTFGGEDKGNYTEAMITVSHQSQGGAIVCGHILSDAYEPYAGQLLFSGFAWPNIHLFNLKTSTESVLDSTFMPTTVLSYSVGYDGYLYAVDMTGTISRLTLVQNSPLRVVQEPTGGYIIDVFDNQDFAGEPIYTILENTIEYEWAEGNPFDLTFDDHFSIRAYNGFIAEVAANYLFTTFVDDGVRIYLDDQIILDEWHDSSGAYYEVKVEVDPGFHVVRYEFYEGVVNATFKANFYPVGD